MAAQEVFKRVEKKYMLDEKQYCRIREVIDEKMTVDAFGLSTISNIYYDTEDYSMIRRSIDGPVYKEKLRLRGYGTVKPDSELYMEIKKKYQGVVFKRRQPVTVRDGHSWFTGLTKAPKDTQIAREIQYMKEFYHPEPKVMIAYDRIALFGNEDHELRITFDFDIRFRTEALDLTKGSWGQPLLPGKNILMEVKIPGAFPLWLLRAMEELHIHQTHFSKYGTCYEKYLSHGSAPKNLLFLERRGA